MERVTGVGGFFFRARDPAGLRRWYEEHLGIRPPPSSYDEPVWEQEAGPTVFDAFAADDAELVPAGHVWMINFRVGNLEAMVAQLEAAGVAVEVDPETYPNGRFARTADPEGNPIQLWEPAEPA